MIVLRYLRACVGFVMFLVLATVWLITGHRAFAHMAFRAVCLGFGLTVRSHGTPCTAGPAGGVLFVANHQSWTDIAVLAVLVDAGFVAKHEVRHWPLIGLLAARYGCLFVERERRGQAQAQAQALTARLAGSHDGRLILFPEATTGDGQTVLPFRSSLFALVEKGDAGGDRPMQVQPVAIIYRRRDGSPFDPDELRRVAWVDDETLLSHACGLAASGGALAEIWFEPPITGANRKERATAARAAIVERLENS